MGLGVALHMGRTQVFNGLALRVLLAGFQWVCAAIDRHEMFARRLACLVSFIMSALTSLLFHESQQSLSTRE